MKNKVHLYSIIYIMTATVLFTALSFVFCSHTYIELSRTFQYDADTLYNQLLQVGGFSHIAADYLCQFFIYPTVGILLNALLLALITFEMSTYLSRIAWSGRLQLLAFLPTLALFFAHANHNYLYEGTIGIFLMLICFNIRQKIENKYIRRVYTILATILLYGLAGPIAMLFALTMLVSRFSPFAFFPLTISYLLAGISLRMNSQEDLMHLLSPLGFFSAEKYVNQILAWLPWLIWLAILSIGLTIRHYRLPQWITKNLTLLQLILIIAFTIIGSIIFID